MAETVRHAAICSAAGHWAPHIGTLGVRAVSVGFAADRGFAPSGVVRVRVKSGVTLALGVALGYVDAGTGAAEIALLTGFKHPVAARGNEAGPVTALAGSGEEGHIASSRQGRAGVAFVNAVDD